MNQTQKRLNIIKLAISIGDNDTIQLQLLKLAPLKTDEKIQEIIQGLRAENYAKTQALITEYLETPLEEILQRTSQEETSPEEEEAIIEEFDLFRVAGEESPDTDDQAYELESETQNEEAVATQPSNLDTLLSLTGDDVLTHNTTNIKHMTLPQEDDDFFDIHHTTDEYRKEETEPVDQDDFFHITSEEDMPSLDTDDKTPVNTHNDEEKEPQPSETSSVQTEEPKITHYDPIPYIDQKLKTMQTQYPPIEEPDGSYPAVDAWLIKISNDGYTEKEVEETIAFIQKLMEKGELAEAAQLLLISAATQSKYAQFMLARSLFKGDLLQRNLPEAFTLINRLAMDDDYPEAICDLGQMYESGIGIDRDRKRAEELYKEAMELGIKRAAAHYERVHHANKGLLSKLLGK
jgi:hypothetical protein